MEEKLEPTPGTADYVKKENDEVVRLVQQAMDEKDIAIGRLRAERNILVDRITIADRDKAKLLPVLEAARVVQAKRDFMGPDDLRVFTVALDRQKAAVDQCKDMGE